VKAQRERHLGFGTPLKWLASFLLAAMPLTLIPATSLAHGISESSRAAMVEGGLLAYLWLGAEHMLTGYDHLLFLFGVLFFLSGFRDIVRFITAFTLGHCITLLGATMLGISANPYLIDAVIALTVIYKGFENLDGFQKYLGLKAPNLLAMVFLFGLIHGFGLSTRLQELGLGDEGIIPRILAFNGGVELGQIAALAVMLGVFSAWRHTASFARFSNLSNQGLIIAGLGLFTFQMVGFNAERHHHDHEATHHAHGSDEDEHGSKSDHGHGPGSDHEHGADSGSLQDAGKNSLLDGGASNKEQDEPADGGASVDAGREADAGSMGAVHRQGPKGHHHGRKLKGHHHGHKPKGHHHRHRHKGKKAKKKGKVHRHGDGPAHQH
tara:strand:- start:198 stop:1337 length:1140 start_codon:yes stop_codon:yes gene_type:complete